MKKIAGYILSHKKFTKTLSFDVLAKGMGFLFIPVFLKLMTQEEFGLYSYLVFTIMNLSYLFTGGLDASLTKLYFDYKEKQRGKLTFTLSMTTLGIFAFVCLLSVFTNVDEIIFHKITSPETNYQLFAVPIFVYILLFSVTVLLNSYYVAASKVNVFQKWNLIKIVGQNLAALGFIWFSLKSNNASVRLMAESISGIILMMPLMLDFSKTMTPSIDWNILQRALKIGIPTLGGVAVGIVYNFFDKYFIQKSSGIEVLAVYNLAMLLATPINIIFGSFHLLWRSEFFNENNLQVSFRKTIKIYGRFSLFYFGLFVVLFAGVWILLKLNIIEHSYFEVLAILPLIYLYRVFNNLSHLFDVFYIKMERTIITLFFTLVCSALTLFLFFKFVPVYGMYACGVILAGMELLRTMMMVIFIRKKIFADY